MLANYLLCALQISALTSVVYAVAKFYLPTKPLLTARLCWICVVTSAAIVLVTVFSTLLPKPSNVLHRLSNVMTSQDKEHSRESAVHREHEIKNNLLARATGVQILAQLNRLIHRVEHASNLTTLDHQRIGTACHAVILVFLVGALLWAAMGTMGLIHLHRSSDELCTSVCQRQVEQIVARMNLVRIPSLRQSKLVDSPCVTWLKPHSIYVPHGFSQWKSHERDVALAHELAHLERGDAWYRAAASVCAAVLFIHPLVGVIYRQFVLAQEVAADRRGAILLGNSVDYRKALTTLVLRIDGIRSVPISLGVSVSSHDVIRRIKMLNSMDVVVYSERRKWCEHFLTGLVLCMGLVAVCWAAEDGPVRVATRSLPSANSTMPNEFSAEAVKPWSQFGDATGYFMIRLSELASHPQFQDEFSLLKTDVLKGAADREVGLLPENISLVQSRLFVSVSNIPKSRQVNDAKHQLTAGMDSFVIQCSQPVDWSTAADRIHMAAFAPVDSEAVKAARKLMKSAGTSTELRVTSKDSEKHDSIVALSAIKQLWRFVDGGTLALSTQVPGKGRSEALATIASEEDTHQALPWLMAVDAIALGLDLADTESGSHRLRFALAPSEDHSAEGVAQLLEVTLNSIVESGSPLEPSSDNKKQVASWESLLTDIQRWDVVVHQPVNTGEREFVVVEGELRQLPRDLF